MLDESSFEAENLPIPYLQLVDPLGEIRRVAKELWISDGRPSEGEVMDYWRRAEEQMLAVRNISYSDHSVPTEQAPEAPAPEFDHILAEVLYGTLKRRLTYHEAICFAVILHGATLMLGPSAAFGPLSEDEIAKVLAELPVDFDEEQTDHRADSKAELQTLWQQRLVALFAADEALSNLDRLTIARLSDALKKHPKVSGIVPQTQTVVDCFSTSEKVTKQTK